MLQPSFRAFAPLAFAAALATAPAAAKDKDQGDARPVQVQKLYDCRAIADPAARLACFDREVAGLAAADESREIRFADKAAVKKARRGLFGFGFPKLGGIFGGDEEDIKEIEAVIRSVSTDRSGKYILTMDDDAVWVQIDSTSLPRQPKAGQKVRIRVASMGSYFATVEGGRAFRMKRDR